MTKVSKKKNPLKRWFFILIGAFLSIVILFILITYITAEIRLWIEQREFDREFSSTTEISLPKEITGKQVILEDRNTKISVDSTVYLMKLEALISEISPEDNSYNTVSKKTEWLKHRDDVTSRLKTSNQAIFDETKMIFDSQIAIEKIFADLLSQGNAVVFDKRNNSFADKIKVLHSSSDFYLPDKTLFFFRIDPTDFVLY